MNVVYCVQWVVYVCPIKVGSLSLPYFSRGSCIAAFISMYSDEQSCNFVVCVLHISFCVFEVAQVVASATWKWTVLMR